MNKDENWVIEEELYRGGGAQMSNAIGDKFAADY